MKKNLKCLLPAVLGTAGFLLRLLQQGVFEPDTGLAARGDPRSAAMAVYLAAVGVLLLAAALRTGKAVKLDMAAGFRAPSRKMLPALVCGIMLLLAGGALTAFGGFRGGDALAMALGVCAVAAALCLFYGVTLWRRDGSFHALLLAPVLMGVVWLLVTYKKFSDYPVAEALYVQILAIAAITYAFYQVAAYSFSLGSRRVTRFILPAAVVLGLTALADDLSTGLLGLYVGCTVVLFGFLVCEKE